MAIGFAKPENALKRAEELVAVGQQHAALQALHDVITSKRHRTWAKVPSARHLQHGAATGSLLCGAICVGGSEPSDHFRRRCVQH